MGWRILVFSNKTKNTTQKTKKMSNTDPTPKTVENANKKMLRLIPDNLFLLVMKSSLQFKFYKIKEQHLIS
jgi:hypothetical protein